LIRHRSGCLPRDERHRAGDLAFHPLCLPHDLLRERVHTCHSEVGSAMHVCECINVMHALQDQR
jgi:hypothetical protein